MPSFRRYPIRRRNVRTIRRRPKKYYRGPQALNVQKSRIHNGPPNHMIFKIRYAIHGGLAHQIDSTSGAVVDFVYRANSCFDPYAGAGGHQPSCFDQVMAMYRHGVVLGSQCVIKFFMAPSAANAMKVAIVGRDSETTLGAAAHVEIGEGPRTVQGILTGANAPVTLVKRYSYKYFAAKDPEDVDDLHFSSGADASEKFSYHICGYAMGGATQACDFTGYIDYICKFIHPVQPPSS